MLLLSILFCSHAAIAQTVAAAPATVIVGEPIYVSFTAPAGSSASDWIGLYSAADPNTAFQDFRFTGGATSGYVVFYAPSTPGNYQFRYLTNNSYNSVASANVTVESTAGFSISVSGTSASGNDPVTVSWTAPAARPATDWIGLFQKNEPDNHNFDPVRWIYTGGASSGSYTFNMPENNGEFVFRYLVRDSYTHAAESATVNVSFYSLTVSATTVAPGGQITVSWKAPAGSSALDWVGLFTTSAPSTQSISYVYTNGATSGSHVFTMPTTPGTYNFRYLLNDGSTDVVRTQTITVQ